LKTLYLSVLGIEIRVQTLDPFSFELFAKAFAAFLVPSKPVHLDYGVTPNDDNKSYTITRDDKIVGVAVNAYELLYLFEKDLTLKLQRLRADLLFLHAGALEYHKRAVLLVAPSGSGKSTMTWALLQSGLNYLSDELAPIDLDTFRVSPYPHALCLKSDPPEPFAVPSSTLRTEYTLHVPTSYFQRKLQKEPIRLSAILFVRYKPRSHMPTMRAVSGAEAAARVYSNCLNLLAHERFGLNAAVQVAGQCDCYELISGDLEQTCELVKSVLAT
jgi:hypothetical protein